MTNEQCTMLSAAPDAKFPEVASSYGFDCAGPSRHGSFLIREPDGRAWLFGAVRRGARYLFGRTVVESVWTDLNVAVMQGKEAAQ